MNTLVSPLEPSWENFMFPLANRILDFLLNKISSASIVLFLLFSLIEISTLPDKLIISSSDSVFADTYSVLWADCMVIFFASLETAPPITELRSSP